MPTVASRLGTSGFEFLRTMAARDEGGAAPASAQEVDDDAAIAAAVAAAADEEEDDGEVVISFDDAVELTKGDDLEPAIEAWVSPPLP